MKEKMKLVLYINQVCINSVVCAHLMWLITTTDFSSITKVLFCYIIGKYFIQEIRNYIQKIKDRNNYS